MLNHIRALFFHLRGESWRIRWFFYWSALILGYVLSEIRNGPDTTTKTAVQWFFWLCLLMSALHLYMVWSSGLYKEWLPFIGKKTRKTSTKKKPLKPQPAKIEDVAPPAAANDGDGNGEALDFTKEAQK